MQLNKKLSTIRTVLFWMPSAMENWAVMGKTWISLPHLSWDFLFACIFQQVLLKSINIITDVKKKIENLCNSWSIRRVPWWVWTAGKEWKESMKTLKHNWRSLHPFTTKLIQLPAECSLKETSSYRASKATALTAESLFTQIFMN